MMSYSLDIVNHEDLVLTIFFISFDLFLGIWYYSFWIILYFVFKNSILYLKYKFWNYFIFYISKSKDWKYFVFCNSNTKIASILYFIFQILWWCFTLVYKISLIPIKVVKDDSAAPFSHSGQTYFISLTCGIFFFCRKR